MVASPWVPWKRVWTAAPAGQEEMGAPLEAPKVNGPGLPSGAMLLGPQHAAGAQPNSHTPVPLNPEAVCPPSRPGCRGIANTGARVQRTHLPVADRTFQNPRPPPGQRGVRHSSQFTERLTLWFSQGSSFQGRLRKINDVPGIISGQILTRPSQQPPGARRGWRVSVLGRTAVRPAQDSFRQGQGKCICSARGKTSESSVRYPGLSAFGRLIMQ